MDVLMQDVIDAGWARVCETTGYLSEREARFLMTALALTPAQGANVEIGSFKGRSTVGLAYVARELGLGVVTAIDQRAVGDRSRSQGIDNFVR